MLEYKEFAKYYDLFYQNKSYDKEVNFISHFIEVGNKILDVGCGTGKHAEKLEVQGYVVDGLDLNQEMLSEAKKRLKGNLYCQNLLDIDINEQYDIIISMFAVINHLKNIDELEKALTNLKRILKPNGTIIIDLHNPQKSGSKTDTFGDMTRTMTWNYNPDIEQEITDITFNVAGDEFHDQHLFRIFSIDEIVTIANKVGLTVLGIYENYDISKEGKATSKNLQFIIKN